MGRSSLIKENMFDGIIQDGVILEMEEEERVGVFIGPSNASDAAPAYRGES